MAFDASKVVTTIKAKNEKGVTETRLITSERDIEIQLEVGIKDGGTQSTFEFMKNDSEEGKIYSRCPDNLLDFLNQYFLKYNRYPNINTNINYYKNYGTPTSPRYEVEKSLQGPLTTIYKTSEFPFEQINEYMQKAILDCKGGETSIPMTNQHYYIQDERESSYCDALITPGAISGTIHAETPVSIKGKLVIVVADQQVTDQTFTLTAEQCGQSSVILETGHINIDELTMFGAEGHKFSLNGYDHATGKIDIYTKECQPGETVHVTYKYIETINNKDAFPCRYIDYNGKNKQYEWGIMPRGEEEGISYNSWKSGGYCFGTITFVMAPSKEGEKPILDRLYFSGLPTFEKLEIELTTFTGATEDTAQYLYALEGFLEENFNRVLSETSETEQNARFKISIEVISEGTEPKLQMKMETSRFKRTMPYTPAGETYILGDITLTEIREDRVDDLNEDYIHFDHSLHLPEIHNPKEEIPFTLAPKK